MCIFDASRRQGGGTRGRESEYDSDPAAMDGLGTPLFLRELSFGRREGNGVRNDETATNRLKERVRRIGRDMWQRERPIERERQYIPNYAM